MRTINCINRYLIIRVKLKDMVIGMLCIIKILGNNLRKPINPQVIAHHFYNTQYYGCMVGCILDLISLACQFAQLGFYDMGCQRRLTGTILLSIFKQRQNFSIICKKVIALFSAILFATLNIVLFVSKSLR